MHPMHDLRSSQIFHYPHDHMKTSEKTLPGSNCIFVTVLFGF